MFYACSHTSNISLEVYPYPHFYEDFITARRIKYAKKCSLNQAAHRYNAQ